MSSHTPSIPACATHEPDLSKLSPDERRRHHVQAMREIRFNGSPADVRAYQARHPETAAYKVRSVVTVAAPKPAGYADAVAGMVGQWLSSAEALRQTNQADVAALNALFGGQRFNPANYLNRPVDKALLTRIAGLFDQRGHRLPADADTLAKIKKAAKAARAGTLPGATAFGGIGTLSGAVLTIGGEAFRIVPQHGHRYVRFYMAGKEARLRLDLLTTFLGQSGLLDGPRLNPSSPLFIEEGETVTATAGSGILPGETVTDASAPTPQAASVGSLPGETVTAGEHVSLTERITRLIAARRPDPAIRSDGIDPLEIGPAPAQHSTA